jgi:hypothetical protein
MRTMNYVAHAAEWADGQLILTMNYVAHAAEWTDGQLILTMNYVAHTAEWADGQLILTMNYVAHAAEWADGQLILTMSNSTAYPSDVHTLTISTCDGVLPRCRATQRWATSHAIA